VLVGDPVLGEQRGQLRLRHPGPPRLRPVAHVDDALHARGIELGREGAGHQAFVADGPDGGHVLTVRRGPRFDEVRRRAGARRQPSFV
jgi:hypothetical protein